MILQQSGPTHFQEELGRVMLQTVDQLLHGDTFLLKWSVITGTVLIPAEFFHTFNIHFYRCYPVNRAGHEQ